jgi:hypothetical protein
VRLADKCGFIGRGPLLVSLEAILATGRLGGLPDDQQARETEEASSRGKLLAFEDELRGGMGGMWSGPGEAARLDVR